MRVSLRLSGALLAGAALALVPSLPAAGAAATGPSATPDGPLDRPSLCRSRAGDGSSATTSFRDGLKGTWTIHATCEGVPEASCETIVLALPGPEAAASGHGLDARPVPPAAETSGVPRPPSRSQELPR